MPSPVPTPVAAVIGLVPTVLDGVRSLPLRAVQLPVFAVSSVLTGLDSARRGYDDLAERGERLLARLRGTSFDDLEDRVEDALAGTPFAKPYDAVEDALEDAGEAVTAFARSPRKTAAKAARRATTTVAKGLETAADAVEELVDSAGEAVEDVKDAATAATGAVGDAASAVVARADDLVEDAVEAVQDAVDGADPVAAAAAKVAAAAEAVEAATAKVEDAEAQVPKGKPTPMATQPDATRITTAASPQVVEAVERVSAVVGGEVVDHDDLPLPDYDHLTLGALRGRMRSLDLPQLVQLRDYEQAKARRLPVVTMLDNRIAKLAADPTAPLSGGDVAGPSAKAASPKSPAKGAKSGGSKVTPATASPDTAAPGTAFGGLGGDVSSRT